MHHTTHNHIIALALALAAMVLAPTAATAAVVTAPDSTWATNPTGRVILPLKHQSITQQQSDQADCFDWACTQLGWDPYEAYDALVEQGYAVALSRAEMLAGLVFLVQDGATIGAIAGDLVGDPETGVDDGTDIGVAISVAGLLIRTGYLTHPDDPGAQRVVSRYERALSHWDRKFAGCLKRKGYRVPAR